MWTWDRGFLNARHQKSVRLDDFTVEVINNYKGRNFSDKLRNYIYDTERLRKNKQPGEL